jgi:thioredoxin reductase
VSKTVDVVIVAGDSSAISVAIDAARRGVRVLVVIRSPRGPLMQRLRRTLRAAGTRVRRGVTIFTNAEVVCVDGLDRVEAVIIRRIGTGRLIGVNASAIHVFGAANEASSVETAKRDPNVTEYEPSRCRPIFVKNRPLRKDSNRGY